MSRRPRFIGRPYTKTAINDKRLFVRMPYVQLGTLGITTSIIAWPEQYRLNSLFAPGVTVPATQPLGLDQYGAMYREYFVYGCRVSVNFFKANNSVGVGWVHLFASNDLAVPSADINAVHSNPMVISKQIIPWNGRGGPVTLKKYYRIKNWMEEKRNPEGKAATIGSNPDEEIRLNLGVSSADGTAVASDLIIFRIKMVFYTMMFNPPTILALS